MGKPKDEPPLPNVAAALAGTEPPPAETDEEEWRRHPEGFEDREDTARGGLLQRNLAAREKLCRMVFEGWENVAIARSLGVSRHMVDRAVVAPWFVEAYEFYQRGLLARIDDHIANRLSETVLEVVEELASMATKGVRRRGRGKVGPGLQARVGMWFVEWYGKLAKERKGGGFTDSTLKAIFDRAITRQTADGSVVTDRVRVTGPIDAAQARRAWGDEQAGGGTEARADTPAGAPSGGDGAQEDARGAGTPRLDAGGGVEGAPAGERDGDADGGGEKGAPGADPSGRFGAVE